LIGALAHGGFLGKFRSIGGRAYREFGHPSQFAPAVNRCGRAGAWHKARP
jgi:hypothetical protein